MKQFLEAVFESLKQADGSVICLARDLGGNKGFHQVRATERRLELIARREPEPWYFCISTVAAPDEEGTVRRRKEDAVEVFCVVLDDIGTKSVAPELAPSWVIESSPGNFQWGYLLEPTTDFELFDGLIDALVLAGHTDGGAKGVTRIMRVPGSLNTKPQHGGWTAKLISMDPTRSWTLDGLVAAFGLDVTRVAAKAAPVPLAVEAREGVDPVLDWLYAEGYVIADDGGMWVKIFCPWLKEEGAGHTTGEDAGYSPLGRGDRPEYRGFHCFHDHATKHTTGEFLEWVMAEGGPPASVFDPIPLMQHRYVMIENEELVADMEQRPQGGYWLMTWSEFGKRFPGNVRLPGMDRAVSIRNAWLADINTRHVAQAAYVPGAEPILEQDGQQCVNVWKEPSWAETHDAPTATLKHLEFLLPDVVERELFLDWLAWKIQNPGRRSYAVCMVAQDGYGTGRSWLKQLLTDIVKGGVNPASLSQLIGADNNSQFNGWASRCQFVVVEEARAVDREEYYQGYETFKQNVDTRATSFICNPKYGKQRDDVMWFNVLIFSNHADALLLPENDRRVCVLTNPEAIAERAHYDMIEAALGNGEAARAFWYLKRRDVSGFDHVYPPMTPGKQRMIEGGLSAEDEIEQWIREHAPDLITKAWMEKAIWAVAIHLGVDEEFDTSRSQRFARRLWKKLGKLGEGKNGARVTFPTNGRMEVRAVRGRGRWSGGIVDFSDIDDVVKNNTVALE